jgi:hypothetical protein
VIRDCATCGILLEPDEVWFHMVASPNGDALGGESAMFPLRYQIHRERHVRQADKWAWEHLCKGCYLALPCQQGRMFNLPTRRGS